MFLFLENRDCENDSKFQPTCKLKRSFNEPNGTFGFMQLKMFIVICESNCLFLVSILESNVTEYEWHSCLKKFVFDCPFTNSGSAHGALDDQFNKKTILTTENSFPFVKVRIKIDHSKTREVILTPIEVATEDLANKVKILASNIENKNTTLLQLSLSGMVATTVNAGPLFVAETFLRLFL